MRAKPEEPVFSDDRSKRRKLTGTWHALQQPLLTVITPSMELLLLLIVSRFPFVEMVSPPPWFVFGCQLRPDCVIVCRGLVGFV